MKKIVLSLMLVMVMLFTSGCVNGGEHEHIDKDNNGVCDICDESVLVNFDIFAINDLHGKLTDNDSQIGVEEMTTYIKRQQETEDNVIILSSGDMWQGGAESNLTKGLLTTEWMNYLSMDAMTIGNHEFDWGEEAIADNAELADFPLLGINIIDKDTDFRVDYAKASTIVELEGNVKVGIIGAIGDVYGSIATDKTKDVRFATGDELTELVMAESDSLRAQGVDFVIYSIHDGGSEYDIALSDGYVDIVFEAHSHQSYVKQDDKGIYHLQGGGDNKIGIIGVDVNINSVTGKHKVTSAKTIKSSVYEDMESDGIIDTLIAKYDDQLSFMDEVLGTNSVTRKGGELTKTSAELYVYNGQEKWGDEYDIVLGGGSINVRSPYNLYAGDVTYAKLMSLFPFDNDIVLCSITGSDLKNRFINNDKYVLAFSEYGNGVKYSIDYDKTYYIVTDTWNSGYEPNKLTVVEYYGDNLYARDFLAEYASNGGFE